MNNNDETGGVLQSILYFFILILLLVLLSVSIYAGYIIYRDLPREPENLNVVLNPEANDSTNYDSDVNQFNKNMKFNHNNISYRFFDCNYEQEIRVLNAFEILSNETGLITFVKSLGFPDIEILCSETSKQTQELGSEYFIAGEGGAKEIIQTIKYNIITSGSILLYDSPTGSLKCNSPEIELHELLHVFGFDHSSNKNSLMNPYLSSCKQKIDVSIINELKRLYAETNLPDLYFETFSQPIKKGRYLDLNFTIKNSGTVDAENASFSIIEEGKILETHSLADINFGAGVLMKMENIKLRSSDPKQISIIIDYNQNIPELDKENNIAEITF
ncbi:matrixin family metalloprotease [Candidatus Pacearchaeota archaeon]|nr:matrixin family metalloprotease [Candidatus Pacearchaeota archaeon]